MFKLLTKGAEELLEELLNAENAKKLIDDKFTAYVSDLASATRLRRTIDELVENQLVMCTWYGNSIHEVRIPLSAEEYFIKKEENRQKREVKLREESRFQEETQLREESQLKEETRLKEEARLREETRLQEQRLQELAKAQEEARLKEEARTQEIARLNDALLIAERNNSFLYNIFDLSANIEKSVVLIKSLIDEKGGEDKDVLIELLEEAIEIIEEVNSTRRVPKRKRFFNGLSAQSKKNRWFYSAILCLMGRTGLNMLNE